MSNFCFAHLRSHESGWISIAYYWTHFGLIHRFSFVVVLFYCILLFSGQVGQICYWRHQLCANVNPADRSYLLLASADQQSHGEEAGTMRWSTEGNESTSKKRKRVHKQKRSLGPPRSKRKLFASKLHCKTEAKCIQFHRYTYKLCIFPPNNADCHDLISVLW